MASAIDLSLGAVATPRLAESAEPPSFRWPSFFYWMKAGVGLAFGVAIAGFVILPVYFVCYALFMIQWMRAIARIF